MRGRNLRIASRTQAARSGPHVPASMEAATYRAVLCPVLVWLSLTHPTFACLNAQAAKSAEADSARHNTAASQQALRKGMRSGGHGAGGCTLHVCKCRSEAWHPHGR